MSHRTVLFLCTGNYYRSRFAEHLFNHLAEERGVPWRAVSRGLSHKTGPWKVGPISSLAVAALKERRVPIPGEHREPAHCRQRDLDAAALVIALKEPEHRPMILEQFGAWAERIEYWHVHDIDVAAPETALAELEQRVRALLDQLARDGAQEISSSARK